MTEKEQVDELKNSIYKYLEQIKNGRFIISDFLTDGIEKKFVKDLIDEENLTEALLIKKDYKSIVESHVIFSKKVNDFLDNILINCEDEGIKQNRIAIIRRTRDLFIKVLCFDLLHADNSASESAKQFIKTNNRVAKLLGEFTKK